MNVRRTGLIAGALAFGLFVFAGFNAVWTTIDGEPRFGSRAILNSGAPELLAKIPNPFRKDASAYLLPPLPEIEGWERRHIADPWTVRPIGLDGSIPTDEEMQAYITKRYGKDAIPTGLNWQAVQDRRARARGAKRTAANYSDGTVAFNVVIERLPDEKPVSIDRLGPFGLWLYGNGKILQFAFAMVQQKHVIAGVPFVELNGPGEGTQQDARGVRLSLESVQGGNALRIWGNGTTEDVERLLLAVREATAPEREARDLE